MEKKEIYHNILKHYWGYDNFRGIQEDIINSIGSGKDTLGLMPTGGGKSITFQVPALAMDGVCIVITPLIALMKDQVAHLLTKGIQAAAIYSGMNRNDVVRILENCIYGGIKILYVSPERLNNELFRIKLSHMKVSFITVDEAHCISQWGYDFRPSYLEISNIRDIKPNAAILALTATATPQVVDDIQEKLGFKHKNVFRMSFERKNLAYVVRACEDKEDEIVHILRSVNGSAIVYTRSRRRTKETAQMLEEAGISATWYHAGLDNATKDERQKKWQNDEIRVMVATNAFGMGIDKPDVRLVIHIESPDSIEAYFQEAGRAGRDGNRAWAVLLYNNTDSRNLQKRVKENFPEKEFIRDVYEHLAYFFEIGVGEGLGTAHLFPIEKFCAVYHYPIAYVKSALQILQQCGYIKYDADPDRKSRFRFNVDRDGLYLLNGLGERTDKVIETILRLYTGTFTDYQYIEENIVAMYAGLTPQQVYIILRSLHQRHIASFIPQKAMPIITYERDRVDGDKVIIPKEIYEDRKEQYIKRVKAIMSYGENNHVCRSRQLLLYFGEKTTHDCGHCDVCLNDKRAFDNEEQIKKAGKEILELLSDKKPHCITELKQIIMPDEYIERALRYMLDEEIIYFEDGQIKMHK